MTSRFPAIAAATLALLPLVQAAEAQTAATAPSGTVYRNDPGHSGYTPDTMPSPLTLLWRHTTVALRGNMSSPATAAGLVYFGSGSRVYALHTGDGSIAWQFPAGADAGGNFAASPTVIDGAVYVGNDNSQVYKIDAKTGTQIWVKKVGGAVRSSPVVSDGLVYFGSADQNGYALSADTGQVVWSSATGGSITASPTLYNGQALFAASDNSLYSFNASSGKLGWSERLPSDPSVSPPITGDGLLYVGSGDTLYALQGRGGGARWKQKVSGAITAPPTYGGDSVYITTQDRGVFAFSSRGRLRWSKSLDYPGGAPPLLAGGVLMVATLHGILYGLDAQTGATKWEYVVQPGTAAPQSKADFTDIAAAPVWADKTLYVLSDDGTLSAFRSDAVDRVSPQATNLSPYPGSTVAGVRIPYGATVIDMGSGIDPASLSLSVDQAAISLAKYDPTRNSVTLDLTRDTRGDSNRPLRDGPHQVVLKAQDWRGNSVTKTWAFVVDNRLDPPNVPAPGGDAPAQGVSPIPNTPSVLPPPASTNVTPSIPRGSNGRDPDGGVNGGPPPPPPVDAGGIPPPPGGGTPGGGGGGTPPPPTPPAPTPPAGGGAPPPPSPPV